MDSGNNQEQLVNKKSFFKKKKNEFSKNLL